MCLCLATWHQDGTSCLITSLSAHSPLISQAVRQRSLHASHLARPHRRVTAQTALAARAFLRQNVTAIGTIVEKLTRPRLLEALGGGLPGLHLWHCLSRPMNTDPLRSKKNVHSLYRISARKKQEQRRGRCSLALRLPTGLVRSPGHF